MYKSQTNTTRCAQATEPLFPFNTSIFPWMRSAPFLISIPFILSLFISPTITQLICFPLFLKRVQVLLRCFRSCSGSNPQRHWGALTSQILIQSHLRFGFGFWIVDLAAMAAANAPITMKETLTVCLSALSYVLSAQFTVSDRVLNWFNKFFFIFYLSRFLKFLFFSLWRSLYGSDLLSVCVDLYADV